MKSLLILSLSLLSLLHPGHAMPLPDGSQPDILVLKHDQSHGTEQEGRDFTFFAKKYTGRRRASAPAGAPDFHARITDLDETETQRSKPPESLNHGKIHKSNDHIETTPSSPSILHPAQANRLLKPSCPAPAGFLSTASSQLSDFVHRLSLPLFLPSFSSKDDPESESIAAAAATSTPDGPIPRPNSKDAFPLEPWMIVLGMIWLVPITVVLVEMIEYAWMWFRGDIDPDFLDRTASGHPRCNRFMSAGEMESGEKFTSEKTAAGYTTRPRYDDDDSSGEEFDDLVP
ncbi:hypothetical protein PVAR5_8539 [Paecilomyces variotii No. 5]|uniref:Uncharacterized protein n=1 Tax=Byssochlamys spectabilis (strain No. 5 / NBRC 109023) TaxID=1356009 RepID=V5GFS6_BYSSN|nr:hypothetical protein PVAR5_8539 [Paecilomyces variotii No. 5]